MCVPQKARKDAVWYIKSDILLRPSFILIKDNFDIVLISIRSDFHSVFFGEFPWNKSVQITFH
jgi:hypothetical protein